MKKISLIAVAICSTILFSTTAKGSAPENVEFVDLGLSVNWASFNVGATSPEQAGAYYAWGETEEKSIYDWATYKYGKEDMALTKYCPNGEYGLANFTDNLSILETGDDAATTNWGAEWRTPTDLEWMELLRQCKWKWEDNYNNTKVSGFRITSKVNDNFIFLPAAGYKLSNTIDCAGTDGYYWTSVLDEVKPCFAWTLNFYKEALTVAYRRDNLYRSCGRPIRAVSTVKNKTSENGLDLQKLIDDAAAGSTIVLDKDYELGTETPQGVYITKALKLDLNGHTIDGNQFVRCLMIVPENASDEIVIEDNSSAQTGAITNGFSNYGGAIYAATGNIIMNGGKITNSATDGFYWGGGGIYLDVDASLTMNGGEISNNRTEYTGGAGIFAAGKFTMNGGLISNNRTYGGGGGIEVNGITTIKGGKIQKNTGMYGGGIFVCYEEDPLHPIILNLTAADNDSIVITKNIASGNPSGAEGGVTGNGEINLSGKIICKDNICNMPGFEALKNFWTYDIVRIVGDLKGSEIYFGTASGETDLPMARLFATGYARTNPDVDFKTYFTFEGPSNMTAILNNMGDIEVVTTTGLENANGQETAIRKTIENGMVIIEVGGTRYNVLGEVIK